MHDAQLGPTPGRLLERTSRGLIGVALQAEQHLTPLVARVTPAGGQQRTVHVRAQAPAHVDTVELPGAHGGEDGVLALPCRHRHAAPSTALASTSRPG
ncbi:hypothetical protein [Streptomyces canus]|uniref:hypothetical protein n=1 Tax=Streptomyces canus TaxID=58343 RepID=UPI0033BF7A48